MGTVFERTREKLAIRAKGRKVTEIEDQFELREPEVAYSGPFEARKADIGHENRYFWNQYPEILGT